MYEKKIKQQCKKVRTLDLSIVGSNPMCDTVYLKRYQIIMH